MGLFGEPKMALCPACMAPLISTIIFPQYEFYCLECGNKCGFLSPTPGTPTPELDARYDALKAEWDEHVDSRLTVGDWWRDDCDQCRPHREYHSAHATDEEREESDAARAWLEDRAKVA